MIDAEADLGINPALQSYLDHLVAERAAFYQDVRDYRKYARGEHAATLNDDQKALLNKDPNFVLNVCQTVLSAKVDRLKVRSLTVTTPDGNEDEGQRLTGLLMHWWDRSRFDSHSHSLHYATCRDGDGFLIVDYENGRPVIAMNQVYDGTVGVDIAYADGDGSTPLYASKRWLMVDPVNPAADKTYRLNIYYPNRIEKYYSVTSGQFVQAGWIPYTGDGEEVIEITTESGTYNAAVAWLTDTGTPDGLPLGLAVTHFPNNAVGDAYGRSELADIVPGLQDAINLAGVSLMSAAQLAGFPINYIAGRLDKNTTYDAYPGAFGIFPEGATVGQLPSANLIQLIDVTSAYIRWAATITHTPLSYFNTTGQIAAEGTLQQQEAPLLAKVSRTQQAFGNAYEDAARLMLKFEATYGSEVSLTPEQIDELTINCEWHDAQMRNEQAEVERVAALVERLKIPLSKAWALLGFTPDEIETMEQQVRQEQNQAIGQMALAMIQGANNGA